VPYVSEKVPYESAKEPHRGYDTLKQADVKTLTQGTMTVKEAGVTLLALPKKRLFEIRVSAANSAGLGMRDLIGSTHCNTLQRVASHCDTL